MSKENPTKKELEAKYAAKLAELAVLEAEEATVGAKTEPATTTKRKKKIGEGKGPVKKNETVTPASVEKDTATPAETPEPTPEPAVIETPKEDTKEKERLARIEEIKEEIIELMKGMASMEFAELEDLEEFYRYLEANPNDELIGAIENEDEIKIKEVEAKLYAERKMQKNMPIVEPTEILTEETVNETPKEEEKPLDLDQTLNKQELEIAKLKKEIKDIPWYKKLSKESKHKKDLLAYWQSEYEKTKKISTTVTPSVTIIEKEKTSETPAPIQVIEIQGEVIPETVATETEMPQEEKSEKVGLNVEFLKNYTEKVAKHFEICDEAIKSMEQNAIEVKKLYPDKAPIVDQLLEKFRNKINKIDIEKWKKIIEEINTTGKTTDTEIPRMLLQITNDTEKEREFKRRLLRDLLSSSKEKIKYTDYEKGKNIEKTYTIDYVDTYEGSILILAEELRNIHRFINEDQEVVAPVENKSEKIIKDILASSEEIGIEFKYTPLFENFENHPGKISSVERDISPAYKNVIGLEKNYCNEIFDYGFKTDYEDRRGMAYFYSPKSEAQPLAKTVLESSEVETAETEKIREEIKNELLEKYQLLIDKKITTNNDAPINFATDILHSQYFREQLKAGLPVENMIANEIAERLSRLEETSAKENKIRHGKIIKKLLEYLKELSEKLNIIPGFAASKEKTKEINEKEKSNIEEFFAKSPSEYTKNQILEGNTQFIILGEKLSARNTNNADYIFFEKGEKGTFGYTEPADQVKIANLIDQKYNTEKWTPEKMEEINTYLDKILTENK
ncbi:MAG: hypothetical protein V4439_02035 [Patescibacteria group bacterium]